MNDIRNTYKSYGPYERLIKRPLDFFIGLFTLIVLLPLFVVLTIVDAIAMKGNPFFMQPRPGKIGKNGKEKIFKLIKFRTMSNAKDKDGALLPDEKRLNGFGRILRMTSLDELPELFNIIKGDMSIVGPRPLLVSYLPYYTQKESHRHDVRPGLTGLAQINGRNFLTWEEIFEFDLEYVARCSFALDASIILQTVIKVLKRGEIADVQTTEVDKDGTIWVIDNGEKKRLHRPLNEERASYAERNWE